MVLKSSLTSDAVAAATEVRDELLSVASMSINDTVIYPSLPTTLLSRRRRRRRRLSVNNNLAVFLMSVLPTSNVILESLKVKRLRSYTTKIHATVTVDVTAPLTAA